MDFFFFKYIRLWFGFIKFSNLHCVDEQTRQGTDQFQGQDGQNEVKIQPAGLWEGMLYAQCEEESCAASGVYH